MNKYNPVSHKTSPAPPSLFCRSFRVSFFVMKNATFASPPRLVPQVRTLSETVRLDARTKLLNPKFYEGMLASGYEGTREITKRLRNTMGWAATAGEVDNFIFEDANDVFIKDEEMRDRLMNLNPNAFR